MSIKLLNILKEITIQSYNIPSKLEAKKLANKFMDDFNIDWDSDNLTYYKLEEDRSDLRLMNYLKSKETLKISKINPENGEEITVVFYISKDRNRIEFEPLT